MYSSRILHKSLLLKQGLLNIPIHSSTILYPSLYVSSSLKTLSTSSTSVSYYHSSSSSSSSSPLSSLSSKLRLFNTVINNSKSISYSTLHKLYNVPKIRLFSTSKESTSNSTKEKTKEQNKTEEEEEVYETAEPLVARISRSK